MSMLVSLVAASLSAVASDEITNLPGWTGALPSKQYSGYLTFGPNNRKHIHYWYVESTGKNPAAKNTPTVLWMNGGPGCSSLDGWYYEHGPFRGNPEDPTKLVQNPNTWAKVANMLYIEAPVGVGFSYSDDPEVDYKQNDDMCSQDNLHAMQKFFELYPELGDHPFFITGESYGGVYVPTLAEAIQWSVGNGTWKGAKLNGIGVGNGCTGSEIGVCGGQRDKYDTEYLMQTAFIPNSLKQQIRTTCGDFSKSPSIECEAAMTKMHTILGNIDLYNIYGDCINGDGELDEHNQDMHKAPIGESRFFGPLRGPDACIDSRKASAYFNQPGIPEATHVKPINFRWATCATAKGWTYKSNRPNLPRDTYPLLVENMRVVIYNGDWDACVPYTDNEDWTESMGYPVADPWHAWSFKSAEDGSNQVAGYATRYANNNFTFTTIRGGRHEVPETAPLKALELITRLTTGQQF